MAAPPGQDVTYVSNDSDLWTNLQPTSATVSLSPAKLCLESTLPLRGAKIHIFFKKGLLQRISAAHDCLGNMILFKCSVCKERFPTFHPDCQPGDVLQTTAHCSLAVHSWDRPLPPVNSQHAGFATGCCQRCHASLQKVEMDPLLKGGAAFSSANNMDFLDGMLD